MDASRLGLQRWALATQSGGGGVFCTALGWLRYLLIFAQ